MSEFTSFSTDVALNDPLYGGLALEAQNPGSFLSLASVAPGTPAAAAIWPIAAPAPAAAPSGDWAKYIAPISQGLSSITNSIANVINPNRSAGYYNAAGQFVPITAPTQPAIGSSSISTSATNLFTQFLPFIFIGVVLWFFVSIFGHKRR